MPACSAGSGRSRTSSARRCGWCVGLLDCRGPRGTGRRLLHEHPRVGLVIIDTLQRVRPPRADSSYAADYGDLGELKALVDSRGIAVVAVHHTRKMGDADVLNRVSGTTGITGSADSTMVLERASRGSSSATLVATGRDVEHQELRLRFQSRRWELVGRISQEEIEEREVPACGLAVLAFALSEGRWSGTTSRLAEAARVGDISPDALGNRLFAFPRQWCADIFDILARYGKNHVSRVCLFRFSVLPFRSSWCARSRTPRRAARQRRGSSRPSPPGTYCVPRHLHPDYHDKHTMGGVRIEKGWRQKSPTAVTASLETRPTMDGEPER